MIKGITVELAKEFLKKLLARQAMMVCEIAEDGIQCSRFDWIMHGDGDVMFSVDEGCQCRVTSSLTHQRVVQGT